MADRRGQRPIALDAVLLGMVVAVAALVAAALVAPGAVGGGAAYAQSGSAPPPSEVATCPSAAADCVYHVTRSLDTGDTTPYLIREDPQTGHVYVVTTPVLGSKDINHAHLRIYNSSATGYELIKDMNFTSLHSRIADIEVNSRTRELHVAHLWGVGDTGLGWNSTGADWLGDGIANLTTISIGTYEVTGTIVLSHGENNTAGLLAVGSGAAAYGLAEDTPRYLVLDMALDEERDIAYVSTQTGHGSDRGIILAVNTTDTTLARTTVEHTSGDTSGNAAGPWDAYDAAAHATSLAVDPDDGAVYAVARVGDAYDRPGHSWGIATLSFLGPDGGLNPNYTQRDFFEVASNPPAGSGDTTDYNDSPHTPHVQAAALRLDGANGKLLALFRNHTVWSYALDADGHPASAQEVVVKLDYEVDPDAIHDMVLDDRRGLLYVSLFDWFDPRAVVLNASDPSYGRLGAASLTSQPVGMGLDPLDGAVYVMPQWAPAAYVIEGEPRSGLQRMIDAAAAGDTVTVAPGIYDDTVLDIAKALTLESDAGRPGAAVFTGYSRIEVEADDVAIIGLSFEDMDCLPGYGGPVVEIRTHRSTVRDNVTIANSTFSGTCHAAIQKEGGGGITNVRIVGNSFENIGLKLPPGWTEPIDTGGENEFQIMHAAIGLAYHPTNNDRITGEISGNRINGTSAAGIRVFDPRDLTISDNYIANTPASGIGLAHGEGTGSSGVVIDNNTIVNANSEPDLDYLAGIDGSGEPGYFATLGPTVGHLGMKHLVEPVQVPEPDAAISIWADIQGVAITNNTIRGSDGALAICDGVCAFESDGVVRSGHHRNDPRPGDIDLTTIAFTNNVIYAHNGSDNSGVLIRNGAPPAGGTLNATGNYFVPGIPVATHGDVDHSMQGRSVVGVAATPGSGATARIGETVEFAVNFTEATSFDTGSGSPYLSLGGGGNGASAAFRGGSGTYANFSYTVPEGGGEFAAIPGGIALNGSVLAGEANPRAATALPLYLAADGFPAVDGNRPKAASVSSSPGTYYLGDEVAIAVSFSEAVHVAGAPAIPLDVGMPGAVNAAYRNGSGGDTLVFAYGVSAGHSAGRLAHLSEIVLPAGAAIRDGAGNNASLALPAAGSGASLADTTGVTVLGVPAGRMAAAADAAFTGPNTVRIEYGAPLGPLQSHTGPVYGAITASGGAGAMPAPGGVSGLGTDVHTIRFGGNGVADNATGAIALNAGLAGEAGGVRYEFTGDTIPIRAGETARTLVVASPAPVVAIEPDGFVRGVNATTSGESARPSINVTSLAAGDPAPGETNIDVTFPAAGESVRMIASFAEVSFPPNVTAASVPADGVLELYVSDLSGLGEPAAVTARIAAALDISSVGLDLRDVVEVGGNETLIRFDMPVRILLAGQADGRAFYINSSDARVVPIDAVCAADDTQAVHAQLGGAGECQADSGADKVIYTYHLTLFGTVSGDSPLVSAVKAAPAGGTVRVQPGTYAAERLVVDKPLTVEAADPANPPIFTNYSHIVVRPSANGPITISGLVFMDTTRTPDGRGLASIAVVSASGSDPGMPVTIRNNTFGNTCGSGIRAAAEPGAPPVSGLTVQGNVFYDIGMNAEFCTSPPPAPDRADAMVLGRHGEFAVGSGTAQLEGLVVRDNYIFGTTYTGIRIAGAMGAVVEGNHIQDVPDDGIRVLPSSNVAVLGNTIVNANRNPYVNGTAHDGAAGAAVEVWSGSDDVAVVLNRISGSAGALYVCAGMCDPGTDAGSGTGGGLVAVDRAPIGSADGANDVRFNHNVLASSNTGPLVANNAGGSLNARANYYPGHADTAADRIGERVAYLPALGGAGPVRVGVVVADAPGSSVRSIDAAVAAGFGAGAFDYSAAQASLGGLVGIEPVVASVGSPDVSEAAAHNETLEALRTGASDDERMRPVLEDSLSRAMALYDEGGAGGLVAISAMNATYGHYPFVNHRNGTIVAHGSNPSLVGDTGVAVRLAGGPDRLPALYDFGSSDSMTGIRGHPDAAWKWWTYEFANPAAAGATQSKRSIIALHPGPDGTAGNADDLIFGAGHYPPGAPAHLVVAAGDAVASVADLSGGSGVVVSPTSTATTPARLAASGDALFRLAPVDTAAASVMAGLLAGSVDRVVVLNDSASLHSQSMAAALSSPASDARADNRTVAVVSYDSSSAGWAGPAMASINAAISSGGASISNQTAVIYTGRAGALAELDRTEAASSTPADARWYATGDLARAELGMPAPDLARRTNLTAVSQFAEPNAAVDGRLSMAGVSLDASTRGPAYAAYDAAFLLGSSIAASAGTGFADGSMPPAGDVAAGMAQAARGYDSPALGGWIILDASGDLALPDRYAVSTVGADGSWSAAPGGPRAAPGKCGVGLETAEIDLRSAMPGQRSQAATQTVLNTGTRAYDAENGVTVAAGTWKYDGSGATLDPGLTTYRALPGGDYTAATAAGAALPGSPGMQPGEEMSIQFRLDLTSMRTLAAGSISQTVTYTASCR